MDGDRSALAPRRPHLFDELVKGRQFGVGDDDLGWAPSDAGRHRCRVERRGAHCDHRQPRRSDEVDIADAGRGCGVGDAGDPQGSQPPAHRSDVKVFRRRDALPKHIVHAEEPPAGVVDVDPPAGGAVEDPEGAGAVLHPGWAIGHELVERSPVQQTAGRLVPAHGPQPDAGPQRLRRLAQPGCDGVRPLDSSEVDRPVGGRYGQEVDVVVVEPGEEGATTSLEDPLSLARLPTEPRRDDGDDPSVTRTSTRRPSTSTSRRSTAVTDPPGRRRCVLRGLAPGPPVDGPGEERPPPRRRRRRSAPRTAPQPPPSPLRAARSPDSSADRHRSAAMSPVSGSATASAQKQGRSPDHTTRPPPTAASSPNATRPLAARPYPVIDTQTRGPPRSPISSAAEIPSCSRARGPGGLDHDVGPAQQLPRRRRSSRSPKSSATACSRR